MGQKAHCTKCGAELRASLVCSDCGDDPLASPGVKAMLKASYLQAPEEAEANSETKKPRRHLEG